MLKTRNIGAYRDLLVLFAKYGRKDFRLSLAPEEMLLVDETTAEMEPDVQQRAQAFAKSLKEMGPTYVKFGQVLSTRPDIVPQEYIAALESLQDDVEPFSFADVETTIESELHVRISKAFDSLESTPLAAASLGQVHRGVLRDGREVVVKIQRPNVRDQVHKDLEVFTDLAKALEEHTDLGRKMNLVGAIEQAKVTLLNELNYLQEAHNMEVLRAHLAPFPRIYVPGVVHDFTTSRVLTTELVHGRKVSKLTALALIDHDYTELATILTEAYLKQICVDGVWHSDPHPGNIFVRDVEGESQIVLLDFGMVSRISHEFQDEIIKLLLAISLNRGAEVADACVRMSQVEESFEPTKFVHEISTLVASYHDADVKQVSAGHIIFNLIGIANNNDLKAPPELAMLAKTLLNLEAITTRLDRDFDAQKAIRSYAENLMAQKLAQKFAPRNFYPALLDFNQLMLDLPHRAREIIDLLAAGHLTFAVKTPQAEELLVGMHKIANRITVGVVIAALLVSSAMMMRIQSNATLFGYPMFAMFGYLIAVAAGVYLIVSTLVRDKKDEERAKLKGK